MTVEAFLKGAKRDEVLGNYDEAELLYQRAISFDEKNAGLRLLFSALCPWARCTFHLDPEQMHSRRTAFSCRTIERTMMQPSHFMYRLFAPIRGI